MLKPLENIYREKTWQLENDHQIKAAPHQIQNKVDAGIKIAYWRDPVKVEKERKKYKRLGKDPPKTAVLCRLEDEGNFEVVHFNTSDIVNGRLIRDDFDIILVPGGLQTITWKR